MEKGKENVWLGQDLNWPVTYWLQHSQVSTNRAVQPLVDGNPFICCHFIAGGTSQKPQYLASCATRDYTPISFDQYSLAESGRERNFKRNSAFWVWARESYKYLEWLLHDKVNSLYSHGMFSGVLYSKTWCCDTPCTQRSNVGKLFNS